MTTEERHKIDKQFQIEVLTKDLIEMLMEDHGLTMEQAMDTLYKSHTYELVEREETGLYYQGAVYVMTFLEDEMKLKKYAGAWKGDESADDIMATIRENSSVREPIKL